MNEQQGALTQSDLAAATAPFPLDRIGVKVQSVNRERTRAMLVAYVSHIDVQRRLAQVDPSWSCEITGEERVGQGFVVRMRLTLKGVTREEYGDGQDPKAAKSDALKRCAMRFGVAAYLYDWPTPWVPYREREDRFRQWTIEDFIQALPEDQRGLITSTAAGFAAPQSKRPDERQATMPAPQAEPEAEPDPRQDARHAIYRELLELHRDVSAQMPGLSFSELLKKRYGPSESKDLTLAQLRDLVLHLRGLLTEGPRALPEAPPPARERREPKLVTQAQVTRLFTLVGYRGWTEADLRTYLEHVFQLDSTRALNVRQYDQLCRVIETSSFAVAIAEFEKRGGHAQKSQR